jgi:CheY-like chemotaxis protein
MEEQKILLVDDDAAVTFLNRYMLEKSQVKGRIYTAQNGREALELMEAQGLLPDVIFLDVNMPVMNGFEFLEALKAKPDCYNHTNVYMLTSSLREEDKEKALAHSCVKKYFEKPITENMIEEVFGQ